MDNLTFHPVLWELAALSKMEKDLVVPDNAATNRTTWKHQSCFFYHS